MTLAPLEPPTMWAEVVTAEDFRLLASVGFHAVNRGYAPHGERIFRCLCKLRPTRSCGYIGLALALIVQRKSDEAVAILRSANQVEIDERSEVTAYLGLALATAGRTRESTTLLRIAASSSDKLTAELAECLLAGLEGHALPSSAGARFHSPVNLVVPRFDMATG